MDNYIGEIRLFPFKTIPNGWLPCNGQILPLRQNPALFALLGKFYGGDGLTTFGLPNLNGKVIMGTGKSAAGTVYQPGTTGGAETVTLNSSNLPAHNHFVKAAASYDTYAGANAMLGDPNVKTSATQTQSNTATASIYNNGPVNTTLAADSLVAAGAGAAHENRMPYMAMSYCIAITGYYPPHP